jgi:hypothetical protein
MDALDISNFTSRFTVDHVRQWKDQGIGLAIIQLISGVRLSGSDCATQIRTCLDGGLAVDCYFFPGNDGLPLTPEDRIALIPEDLKSRIRQLWVDIEPAHTDPDVSSVNQAHDVGDRELLWQRTGDYSALWVANKLHWHPWPWPDRKQWLVNATNEPNLGGGFDGTDNHVMTQYHEDISLAGVSGMDRSLLSDAEEQAVLGWLEGGSPVRIPQEYVDKFGLPDDSSQQALDGLIDNFEGVVNEVRKQAEGEAATAIDKLNKIKEVLATT